MSETTNLTYRIHLTPEPEGGYTVTVPALQGCVTWGRDYEQAMQMAEEAIQGFLEVLVKHGEPLPQDPPLSADAFVNINAPAGWHAYQPSTHGK